MIRTLYSLATFLAQPLLRRKLLRRGAQEPGYLEAVDERFGRYQTPAVPGALWIHAVSLGETRAAALLVEALREQRPGLRLLLTHGTATGRAEGARLLREGDRQAWLPWDTPAAVDRFLAHFQPCAGILMETEVWPNLVAACQARGLVLALANARLSEASLRAAQRLPSLSRPAYAGLSAVWAQSEADAMRLRQAGVKPAALQVLGNLKFDVSPDPGQQALGRAWRARAGRPVIVFASSRQGEEAMFLQALAQARTSGVPVDRVQWLIVPRHPQRFDEVQGLVLAAGLSVSRRSQWSAEGPPAAPGDVSPCLWLGDTLGEMSLYFSLSDQALLGGSFAPLGGQNLIEAAACGCPVVMGPHTFNFADAAERALASGAAWRVADMADAVRQAVMVDTPALAQARQSALNFASAHRGCAQRTARAMFALT